jgi:predicted dehydrogenase
MIDRRAFLQTGAAFFLSASAAHAAVFREQTLRVGLIGSGWYGKADLFRLIQVAPVEVVSLCDVDQRMLSDAADMVAQRQASRQTPRTYSDYRQMLAERDLNVVLIGTPDHWHALQAIAAMQVGAHVYLQKPISMDVVEGQALVAAARKYDRVVQVGTQRRSTPHLMEAREIIQEGRLGRIGHVDLYCYYHMRARQNPPDTAPPEHLDYEMWTGPAPMRPYNSLVHPRSWRAFMEYSHGILGDMCIHMLDMARWMMDLGWPTRISSNGGIFVEKQSKANTPDTQTATFEFPADEVTMTWQHRSYGHPADPDYPWGATFYGERGTLKASVQRFDFIPQGDGQPLRRDVTYELDEYPEDRTERDLERHVAPAIRYHMLDFLRAIETGGRPVADIREGHISTASCILANLSMQLGRSITWDPETERVVGDEEANRLLARPYRAPWVHPDPATV